MKIVAMAIIYVIGREISSMAENAIAYI